MKNFEATEVQITKADLTRIDSVSLGFLIAAAHTCNELNVLRTLMIFEGRDDQGSDFVRSHTTMRWMTLARIAVGKIHEFNLSVSKHAGNLKRSNTDKAAIFNALKRDRLDVGKQPQWVNEIRNKLAFHVDADYALKSVVSVPDETIFSFFMSEAIGHTAFSFAEQVLSEPIFARLGDSQNGAPELHRGAGLFMEYIIDNINRIVEFVHDYLGHCLKDAGVPFSTLSTAIDRQFLEDPDQVSNPVLVTPRSLQQAE